MKTLQKIFTVILLMISTVTFAQLKTSADLGKGLKLENADQTFSLKFTTRIQTRWDFEDHTESKEFLNHASVKRARLKFDGHFINKDLRYKIEYDVVGGYVRDALIKYKMGDFDLWFGQGKLPGNRERVISSGNMQFVDRSVYNNFYNIDRDLGLQLHHNFKIGKSVIRDSYAISAGNGIRTNNPSDGFDFTTKLEVLPFGEFTNKGDYIGADVFREQTPKLAIAAWADYNLQSIKDRGQIGDAMDGSADLLTLGFDFMFKYSGFSVMGEAGSRNITSGDYLIYDPTGQAIDAFYKGFGLNIQSGYIFQNNWELSGRYSFTNPHDDLFNRDIKEYTLGVSKYILGHNFKIQSDLTFRDNAVKSDAVIARVQLEYQF